MRLRTKALTKIQTNMDTIEKGSFRYEVLNCAKNFKSSWLDLGRHLTTVYNDKMYKSWGYLSFEAYCSKEIGIRKETGMKLLRSYFFLEKEEPRFLRKEYLDSVNSVSLPTYEAVNTLRQAKANKDVSIADYEKIKRHVFEDGKADKEIKSAYRSILKTSRENDSPDLQKEKRVGCLKRMIGTLGSIKKEIKINNFLSNKIVADIDKIISRIEKELELE